MSTPLTDERVSAIRILGDLVDARIANIISELDAAVHDQRSLRTAILALQHELEGDDTKGTP
jgi:hypothetical protein